MLYPSKEKFMELCKKYRVVPVSKEFHADTETPITVYAKLTGKGYSFLLESVEGGQWLGRYSFIGFDPFIVYRYENGVNIVERDGCAEHIEGNPFSVLEDLLHETKGPQLEKLSRFYGGAVGYLGYDLARQLERLPDLNNQCSGVADSIMIFPRTVVIFDHFRHSMRLIINVRSGSDNLQAYNHAAEMLENLFARIKTGFVPPPLYFSKSDKVPMARVNMSDEHFMAGVEKAREYIGAGDILQVVLSRRLEIPFNGSPFNIYRRLRRNNPSPYMYYLAFGRTVIAGSSPEMLVRLEGDMVETRPIAGTRPRGDTPEKDIQLSMDLLADPKERAEHVMLVDLGRNDVGRVSAPGTVDVAQFMEVERYSHVMHLVSSVRGRLKDGFNALDALKSCFPAGTVSGAPKVRAMEIIEEIENTRRGVYAGAVGYIGINGNMDTAIAIRTIIFRDGIASVQAGAGIVADSEPEKELEEAVNKARALLHTLAEEDGSLAVNY